MRSIAPVLALSILTFTLAGCPGGGEDPETPLEYGFEERENYDCADSLILDALLKVCNYVASCEKTVDRCSRVKQELFTGTTLLPVANPRETYWNSFGGRGELMADASLCMLKELSKGGVTNQATARLFEVFPVTVKQKLGFLHFDPTDRLMDGYQTVSICLPIVGCFDAKESAFHAEIRERSPAHPLDRSCGNFPVDGAFALEVTAENSELAMTARIPDTRVNTPYGPIVIQPKLDYFSDMHSILHPHPQDNYVEVDAEHWPVHLHDVYGRIPGVNVSIAPNDLLPSGHPENTGWSSQLGIGSRQPNPNTPLWTENPDYPERPDYDLARARAPLERKPVAGASAEVKITYKPPLPDILTEDPMTTTLEVMAKPVIRAHFASQFDIFFSELTNSLRDSGPALNLSSAMMLSRAAAYASFEIEAGIDLFMRYSSSLFSKTLVDIKPRVKFVVAANEDQDEKTVGHATSHYDPRFDAEPLLSGFQTAASGGSNSPTAYVNECVRKPIPDQPKPEAQFEPGNGDILEMTEFPCNICVGHEGVNEGGAQVPAYSQLVHPSANGGPTNWSCNRYHSGCFDMCAYDPATNALTITRTAIGMGLRGMPRNVACNENPPF